MGVASFVQAVFMVVAGHISTFVGRRRLFLCWGTLAALVGPLLWSATGQAFLGWLSGDAIDQQAQADWSAAGAAQRAQLAEAAPGEPPVDALRRRVRAQGCATVRDLLTAGISAVAAPIPQHDGHVVAVLTALGASGGFDPAPGGRIAGRVVQEAGEISRALGWVE